MIATGPVATVLLELFSDPAVWASFLTLTLLEIVLGVDNVMFISIAAGRLPEAQRRRASVLGLSGAGAADRAVVLGRLDRVAIQAPSPRSSATRCLGAT